MVERFESRLSPESREENRRYLGRRFGLVAVYSVDKLLAIEMETVFLSGKEASVEGKEYVQ